MAAVKSKWFIDKYTAFINANIKLFGENINRQAIPIDVIQDIQDELCSEEMKSHIRKNIENKSIRESAGLFLLGHEMKITTDQITKDVLYTNAGNNHIPPLLAGKDEKGMSWIGEISSMVREILGSLRDVLSGLPVWAKGLLKTFSEIVGLLTSNTKINALRNPPSDPVAGLSNAKPA